jgi:Tol biopolymer transport system component
VPRAALFLVGLLAVAGGTSCSSDKSKSDVAPIAFFRGQELVLIDPDGSNERSLAHFPSKPYDLFAPTWSPNGRQLLVSFHLGDRIDIYVVEADGSGKRKLWRGGFSTNGPLWSPRGDAILIDDATEYRHAMWIVTPDGKARRLPTGDAFGFPAWSPDGTKIAYHGPDGLFLPEPWIYVMNADGSGQKRLTKGTIMSWAPEERIRFHVGESTALWVINPDGSGRRRATKAEELLEFEDLSPHRRMVVRETGAGSQIGDLYVKDLTSGARRKLASRGCCALWSPDGKSLAFVRFEAGAKDIYVINVDGTGERNLTDSPEDEEWPTWAPAVNE